MSLVTNDFDRAIQWAYNKAIEYGIPMEVYSRPVFISVDIDEDTDIEPLQYIATPNISNELPSHWKLEAVIGIST